MNERNKKCGKSILGLILIATIWIFLCWYSSMNIVFFIIGGFVTFWSIFGAGIYFSLLPHENEMSDRVIPRGEYDQDPKLFTLNGFGTRLIGASRNPHLKYQFFCIFYLPLFPVDCYVFEKQETGLVWYGNAEWDTWEIVGIYLKWWGGILAVLFTLYTSFFIIDLIKK